MFHGAVVIHVLISGFLPSTSKGNRPEPPPALERELPLTPERSGDQLYLGQWQHVLQNNMSHGTSPTSGRNYTLRVSSPALAVATRENTSSSLSRCCRTENENTNHIIKIQKNKLKTTVSEHELREALECI